MSFLRSTQSVCICSVWFPVWRWMMHLLDRPPFLCFSPQQPSFLPALPTPPSIFFIPVLKLNTLLDQREEGWWQVKGDYWFLSPPPGPDSLLSVVVIHYLYAPRSLSLCRLSIFSIRLTLVFIQFTFCCHNLLIYDLFFILVLFSSLLFVFFCLFFFLFFDFSSHPLPLPAP